MSADAGPGRRPIRVEFEDGRYAVRMEGVAMCLQGLTEEELRWLGLVLIPAALPPLPAPGIERTENG